jgi:hypothetical protein
MQWFLWIGFLNEYFASSDLKVMTLPNLDQLFPDPDQMSWPDGSARYAFVTFLMMNVSYLASVLLLAYGLKKQNSRSDAVCLVTEELGDEERFALELVFDQVIDVEKIFIPHKRRQKRQDRPFWFTRLHALRLGPDGDMGFRYEKVGILDADIYPLRNFDHLMSLNTPAGIINESKTHFVEIDDEGEFVIPPDVDRTGKWKWHALYEPICPHGHPIPKEITDRVIDNVSNRGLIGAMYIFNTSLLEFYRITMNGLTCNISPSATQESGLISTSVFAG